VQKNSAWKRDRWSAERWFGSGLNEFESFPFMSYQTALASCLYTLGQYKRRMEKIKGYGYERAEGMREKIELLMEQLRKISHLVVVHDRYFQEKDKRESLQVPHTVRIIKY
jgi:hypothetical protein